MKAPMRPNAPELKGWVDDQKTEAIITVSHNTDEEFSPDVSYNFYMTRWENGEQIGDAKVISSATGSIRISDIEHFVQYKFRVETVHKCGRSLISDEYCLPTPPVPIDGANC